MDRRARRGARARGAALGLAVARPDWAAVRVDARGRRSASPYAAAVSSGTAGLHLCMRLAGVGPGDEVITSPYSFVASANCAIYEGATPVFADIDPQHVQPRPGRRRGGDHAAHEGARRGRHLRLPGRVRRADPALREARDRPRRGLVRGARRELQGQAARLARPSGGVGVLSEQADDDGRGRRRHDRQRGGARAARFAPQPGSARDVVVAPARTARLQLPPRRPLGGARDRTAREARPHPRRRAARSQRATASSCGASTSRSPLEDDADHVRSWFVYVVKLPAGADRGAVMERLAAQGIATAPYLPSIHLQSYMRERYGFSRGDAPGERGLQRAHDGAAVPRAARARRSGARRRGAPHRASRCLTPEVSDTR